MLKSGNFTAAFSKSVTLFTLAAVACILSNYALMLARPAQTDVWLCAELVAHSSFLSLRAKIEKEGGRVVDRPTRINGLCVFQHFQGVKCNHY